jgi:hypothetical protein
MQLMEMSSLISRCRTSKGAARLIRYLGARERGFLFVSVPTPSGFVEVHTHVPVNEFGMRIYKEWAKQFCADALAAAQTQCGNTLQAHCTI